MTEHPTHTELVALTDPNPGRVSARNRWLSELGHPPVAGYPAGDFLMMLEKELEVVASDFPVHVADPVGADLLGESR